MWLVTSRGAAALLLLTALLPAAVAAQEPPGERVGDGRQETGWHIVRPGETLIRITAKYLGSPDRWRENWRLNPEIEDPNVIRPGSRLRVLLNFESAPPVARLRTVSGRVEGRPVPNPWNQARVEDLLVERDGLRTYRNSSTELEFRDGANVVLSEESLVFVRPVPPTAAAPPKRSVEIVEGQAEVQSLTPGLPRADIEIHVGTATAVAKSDERGVAQTRARKAGDGGAQVMVYEGSSEVAAAGASVDVPRGMGTAVPQNAPPAPPEKLLPPPRPLEPEGGSEWRYGDPWFAWEPVPDAAFHSLEICRDPNCTELVLRADDLTRPRFRPEPLPPGDVFWRVTAVSVSGLDGFPSEPTPFTILFSGTDNIPPTGTLRVAGESVRGGETTYWEPEAWLELSMTDAESGLDSATAEVDGRLLDPEELGGPWRTGRHLAKGIGIDRVGNLGETETVAFEVDADGPAIEVRLGGPELLTEKLGEGSVPKRWKKRKKKWMKTHTGQAGTRPAWTVLAFGSDERPLGEDYRTDRVLTWRQRTESRFAVEGNNPGVLLFVAGRVRIGSPAVTLAHGQQVTIFHPRRTGSGTVENPVVWISARDLHSAQVTSFELSTERRPSAEEGASPEIFLVIDTTDVFENRRHLEIRLQPLHDPPPPPSSKRPD